MEWNSYDQLMCEIEAELASQTWWTRSRTGSIPPTGTPMVVASVPPSASLTNLNLHPALRQGDPHRHGRHDQQQLHPAGVHPVRQRRTVGPEQ